MLRRLRIRLAACLRDDILASCHDALPNEGCGLLLGAWHSHPDGPPEPSATDRAEAWPDWCYLIAGFAGDGAPQLRAWRLVGEHFVEDILEVR